MQSGDHLRDAVLECYLLAVVGMQAMYSAARVNMVSAEKHPCPPLERRGSLAAGLAHPAQRLHSQRATTIQWGRQMASRPHVQGFGNRSLPQRNRQSMQHRCREEM